MEFLQQIRPFPMIRARTNTLAVLSQNSAITCKEIVVNSREKKICELLCRHNELSVQQISEILKVSASSIRRNLSTLETHPFIRRSHGGAALSNGIRYDSIPVAFIEADETDVRALAYRAAELIQPGDVIGLSGGRMCTQLALNLRFQEDITVVTNAVNIACELAGLPGIKVMVCGGMIDLGSFELVGQLVSRALEGIFIHKFFVGSDGITVEYGLTNRSEPEAMAAREFAMHADRTIVLADHKKFVRSNLARVLPAEKISTIITTDKVDAGILQRFSELGVEILVVPGDHKD
jgi:DeoR/GlpR family transcriptional regulator of sugar metabolism